MSLISNFVKTFSGISLGILIATGFSEKIKAQSMSPLIIETSAERGRAQAIISIENPSNEEIRSRVYAEAFTYNDQGFQSLESDSSSLIPYLRYSPRELIIPPQTTRRIRLSTLFPPDLPDGEYRAVIFAERLLETIQINLDDTGETISNSNIKIRIGATFFVRQGDISPNLIVTEASWNPETQKIQILVNNIGQASVYPSINWTLQQGDEVIANDTLQRTGIIAETERNFILNYILEEGQTLPSGDYQLVGELFWGDYENPDTVPFNLDLTIPNNNE